jgi:hypothetical protein
MEQTIPIDLDSPVRPVTDASARMWHVYVVIEGSKLGARPRADWLCMESGNERRYMSPIPEGWMHWSDATLLHWISVARQDLRD